MACIFLCFELLLVGFYLKKSAHHITWNIELDNVKYRILFDRIPKSVNTFNKLYNLIYFLAKISIIIAIVFELELMCKIVMTAFPIIFLIHDII